MNTFLPKMIDAFLRKHPAVMMFCVIALAVVSFLIVMGSGHSRLVYEGF